MPQPLQRRTKVVGALNPLPFVQCQNQPGETIWDFLERLARPRGIILGNDSFSNVLAVGPHDGPPASSLVEGVNIKKCAAIFHKTHSFEEIKAIGQTAGSDQVSGSAANEQEASWGGTGYYPQSELIVPSEQPIHSAAELKDRAHWESTWLASDEVKIFITVVGWYRAPGKLWWPLDEVAVYSAMIPMDAVMTIQTATFKQSNNGGTETEIELRFPWGLNSSTAIGRLAPPAPPDVLPGQNIAPTP